MHGVSKAGMIYPGDGKTRIAPDACPAMRRSRLGRNPLHFALL